MYSPSAFTIAGLVRVVVRSGHHRDPGRRLDRRGGKAAFPKFGTFGPPVYAATHVLDEAIASACKSGTPTRSSVLSAVKATSEATSILGQTIHFDTKGDLIGAKWFLFKINPQGKYVLVTNS